MSVNREREGGSRVKVNQDICASPAPSLSPTQARRTLSNIAPQPDLQTLPQIPEKNDKSRLRHDQTRQENDQRHQCQQSLSRTLFSMMPRTVTHVFPRCQSGDNVCRRSGAECESREQLRKPNSRDTERWMVGISVAGVIVSGIVLIIVLYPLVTSQPPTTPVIFRDNHPPQPQARTTGNSGEIVNYPSDWIEFKSQSNNRAPKNYLNKMPQQKSPMLHNFYMNVMNHTEGVMNTSAEPCQDFYQYACGNWGKLNPPPEGITMWSNFEEMTLDIWNHMEDELQKVVNGSESSLRHANPVVRDLVVNYYAACENEMHMTAEGVEPLRKLLHQMDQKYYLAVKELQPLSAFQHLLEFVHHQLTIHSFFSWKVETDNKFQDSMAIELRPPSVDILPQGTVLINNAPLVEAYKHHTKSILAMVGTYNNNNIEEEVNNTIDIVNIFLPLSGSPLINDTSIDELEEIAPFLDWHTYFNKAFNRIGTFINKEERILSLIQDYLAIISKKIIAEVTKHGSSERLYIYMRWQVVQYYSQFLYKGARNKILPLLNIITGQKTTTFTHFRFRPCIKELEEKFALPTAYLLLESIKYQLPEGTNIENMIQAVENMAENIRQKYIRYINSFAWIDKNAKNMLLNKLRYVKILVGYPNTLRDVNQLKHMLKTLKFRRTSPLQNQIKLQQFNIFRQMRFLRRPGMYSEWETLSPMSLLSYYMYRRNTLLVPLGGFRYPLYSPDLPTPLTYATMGMFISHELGHAVDFIGRTRDEYGRANASMWDADTVKEFAEKVMCRVKQYSEAYYPVHGLLTIAEVMADDGSIGTAYEAAKDFLHQARFPTQMIDLMKLLNLTPDQLFFVSFAQLFCIATAPGTPLKGIDHYPPHSTRVTATLTNTPQFHQAFSCPKDSPMNNIKTNCDIW